MIQCFQMLQEAAFLRHAESVRFHSLLRVGQGRSSSHLWTRLVKLRRDQVTFPGDAGDGKRHHQMVLWGGLRLMVVRFSGAAGPQALVNRL